MKTKIIVFSTLYAPFVGGAEIAIAETAKRLGDRFDFCIITSRFRRDLPKHEAMPEGEIVRLGFGFRFDKWFFPFLGAAYVLLNVSRRHSVLWGMDISQGSLAASFVKFVMPRVPFLLSIQYGESENRLARGRLGAIGVAFRFMLRQADFLAPESTYLLRLARQYGYRRAAKVIPNGVDILKFQNPKSEIQNNFKIKNPKTIITVSRLVYKNGIDVLLGAMAEVKKEIPDTQLVILGDGEERPWLEQLAGKLGVRDAVDFLGYVPYAEIPGYLHAADVFVRPSRSEGMGNVFVEALAAGLPIIGTPVGGITDIIEDGKTGLFARPEDPHDLARQIARLLKDHALAEHIAQEGNRMVRERFSWDRIAVSSGAHFDALAASLRIAIATPLLPPALGGPAQYAMNLAREFEIQGHSVSVLSYGRDVSLGIPAGFRHIIFLLKFLPRAWKADIIFSLDQFSAGFPAALAAFFLRRPHVTRVAGDFLWESFVERARTDMTLFDFYLRPPYLSLKERLIKSTTGWVLRRADMLAFCSEWRRDMARRAYGIPEGKTAIVLNVFPSSAARGIENSRIILWAGRMLYLKNLYRLIRAFARVSGGTWELHLVGEGPERARLEQFVKNEKITGVKFFPPMPREKLLEKYRASAFFALPSLSDVGPNVIADAVAAGMPFLMTRESGYAEYVGGRGVLVDPLDEADIEEKLRTLMNEKTREEYHRKLAEWKFGRTWQEVAKEWIGLCKRVFAL